MSSTAVAQNVVIDEKKIDKAVIPFTGNDIEGERNVRRVDEMKYPTGWRLFAVATSIVLSMFLVWLLIFHLHIFLSFFSLFIFTRIICNPLGYERTLSVFCVYDLA